MKLLLTTLIEVADGHGLDDAALADTIMTHQRKYGAFGAFSTRNPAVSYRCTAVELRAVEDPTHEPA